jgi:hypothetical protein
LPAPTSADSVDASRTAELDDDRRDERGDGAEHVPDEMKPDAAQVQRVAVAVRVLMGVIVDRIPVLDGVVNEPRAEAMHQ